MPPVIRQTFHFLNSEIGQLGTNLFLFRFDFPYDVYLFTHSLKTSYQITRRVIPIRPHYSVVILHLTDGESLEKTISITRLSNYTGIAYVCTQ